VSRSEIAAVDRNSNGPSTRSCVNSFVCVCVGGGDVGVREGVCVCLKELEWPLHAIMRQLCVCVCVCERESVCVCVCVQIFQ